MAASDDSFSRVDTEQYIKEKVRSSDVAIVLPTLNEEKGIGKMLDSLNALNINHTRSVLVVDGHSVDKTAQIAKEKGAKVIYQRGLGYGDALQTGFEYASKYYNPEVVVMLDADSTYDVNDIPGLIEPVFDDAADLVVGNRFAMMDKGAMTRLNVIGNKILSKLANWVLKLNVKDTQCGIRAIRGSLASALSMTSEGMPFALEMLVEAKQLRARITQRPVRYHVRMGEAKLSPLMDGFRILSTIISLMRDYRPLSFFSGLGAVFMAIGLFFGIDLIREYLATSTITRLPTAILVAALMSVGVQLLSFGLLADMLKNKFTRRFTNG